MMNEESVSVSLTPTFVRENSDALFLLSLARLNSNFYFRLSARERHLETLIVVYVAYIVIKQSECFFHFHAL